MAPTNPSHTWQFATRFRWVCKVFLPFTVLITGCGVIERDSTGVLLTTPLSVNGQSVGAAVVDTGGNYELLLREDYGLDVVGSAEVLVLDGRDFLGVAKGVPYEAGGVQGVAESAIIGMTVCECNGLGIDFLRKHGIVLGIDFSVPQALFISDVPEEGIVIPFSTPPDILDGFDTSFLNLTVQAGINARAVTALLDTGSTRTLMRRGTVGTPSPLSPNRLQVRMTHESLGTITLTVGLFETPGLPTVILGTDAMQIWADRWYIQPAATGGTITVVHPNQNSQRDNTIAIPARLNPSRARKEADLSLRSVPRPSPLNPSCSRQGADLQHNPHFSSTRKL